MRWDWVWVGRQCGIHWEEMAYSGIIGRSEIVIACTEWVGACVSVSSSRQDGRPWYRSCSTDVRSTKLKAHSLQIGTCLYTASSRTLNT